MPSPILPGATLGILGGGQLGRMTAMAARSLGYHIHALDPDSSCAARSVVDRCLAASFDDVDAAADLARGCDVVTLEIEKVSVPALRAAERFAPLRPAPEVLEVVQDRRAQKEWLERGGFPIGPWSPAESADGIAAAARALPGRVFVKASRGGYDGRGQAVIGGPEEADGAWAAVGERPCVVERGLDIEAELSVLVARRPGGQTAVYPPALNHHERQILEWSVLPGPVPPEVASRAMALGRAIADAFPVVGLLVVEIFWLKDGSLLVNELAPRPHNTFHATEVGCLTSQFEQLVRAVCDLPLGSVEVVRPAAIYNLLGDSWLSGTPPAFDAALAIPGVRLHLYGKRVPRPGRKMGHLAAVGSTPEEAVERVKAARDALSGAEIRAADASAALGGSPRSDA